MKHSRQTKIAHQPLAVAILALMAHALQAATTALHALTAQKENAIPPQAILNTAQALRAMGAVRRIMLAALAVEAEIIAQERHTAHFHAIHAQPQAIGNASPARVM